MAAGTISPVAVLRDARFAGSSGRGLTDDIGTILDISPPTFDVSPSIL